jgi:mannose-6-phosphate isomerase-like protein (cupin superfamily)
MAKARAKVKARAKKRTARRSQARSRAKSKAHARTAVKAARPHKFVVSHFRPQDFKAGLRSYAQYRDLGIKDATHGVAVAHVIRLVGPCDPKAVSKLHRHDADFQMIYVLKGSITGEYGSHGVHTMEEGDAWLQPKNIEHKVLGYSDDCELLEIVMPANFRTVELET